MNEFVIKNGFISKGDSIVNGTISGDTLNLTTTPSNDNSQTQVLVRNNTTGLVEYRDASTLSGTSGANTFVTGTTFGSNQSITRRNDGADVLILTGGTNVTLSNPSTNQIKFDVNIPAGMNTYVTGFTYNDNNTFTIFDNDGGSFPATFNQMSGLTVNGDLDVAGDTTLGPLTATSVTSNSAINVFNGHVNLRDNSYFLQGRTVADVNVSLIGVDNQDRVFVGNAGYDTYINSDTIVDGVLSAQTTFLTTTPTLNNSATDILVRNSSTGEVEYRPVSGITPDTNTFVISGTYVDSTDTLSLLRNDGNFVNVTGITDTFTTGSTYDNGTALATFDRNDGTSYTLDLSTIDVNDTFITGFTYNDANTLTISRNDGVDLSTSINTMTGLTVNGTLVVDTISATTISATSISGGTFYGDGSNLTNTPSLYTQNNTVGSNRTATILDSLTWSGGQEIRTVNSRIYREITQASDLPTSLVANTTYILRGQITTSTNHTCNVDGVEIIGFNRDLDGVVWTGTGAFLTLTDCNFNIEGVKFSSTNSGNSILSGTNVSASGYNNNRLKVLTIINSQFRGTYDVMDINGYDLVDINNTLFFYIKATNFGLRFRDTSKVEISSCELIRWFDESTISTPSGWSTASMIELQNNNLVSFGAININGCIIHPQQTQNGIDVGTGSTTGFGTIAANAFINAGLTTGEVFLPVISAGLPNYSLSSTTTFDIYSNQGLLDSKAGSIHTLVNNTTDTSLTEDTPVIVNSGGNTVQQSGVRFDVSSAGRATYTGTKQLYVSIHISLTYLKQGKGSDDYQFYIALNGSVIAASVTPLRDLDDIEGGLSLVYGTLVNTDDYIELWCENTSSDDDMLVTGYKILIRE